MRDTYEYIAPGPFPPERVNTAHQPIIRKVVWHRQGNPGAEGENGINWMARTGVASIHAYVDDGKVFEGVPWDRHAFHVLEHRKAANFGLRTNGDYGVRGDYDTFGVELEDESPSSTELAPGQAYGLSQETRITAVLLGADILRWFPGLTVTDFIEHADLDPFTRPEDVGDALYMPDFRLDVLDAFEGRTPWRTVGKYARGTANPGPAPAPAPEPEPEPVDPTPYSQEDLDSARARGYLEGRTAGQTEVADLVRSAIQPF